MDIYEYRRGRLLSLINERYDGIRKNFCDATLWSEARVSQLLSTTYREGRAFSEKTARRLETDANLPPMYFDQGAAPALVANEEPDDEQVLDALDGAQPVTVGAPSTDVIPVKLVNLRVQAGFPRFDADEVYDDAETIDLPRQWVEENELVPNCLLAIRVKGDSMEPVMSDGEKIIVNIADTKLVSNQLYVVNYDGAAVVKQMVYRNREWWLHSFNSADEFRPLMARSGNAQVIGKVIATPFRSLIGKF